MAGSAAKSDPRRTSGHRAALYLLIAAVLAVRLATFWLNHAADATRVWGQDTDHYEDPAQALVETGRFGVNPDEANVPVIIRTPGYPAFLALVYLVFGHSHAAAIVVQTIFSVATIICVYAVALRLWGPTAAFLSALILSLDLPSLFCAQVLMTESLFTTLLTASVACGVMLVLSQGDQPVWAFLSGLLLGLATLVRPISYFLVPVMILGWLVCGWLAGWRRRQTGAVVLMLALPAVVLIGGWRVRNYVVSGSSKFSHITSVNALYYRAAGVLARRDGIGFLEAKNRLKAQYSAGDDITKLRPTTLNEYGRVGWNIVRQYPGLFVRDQLRGMAVILLAPGTSSIVRHFGLQAEPSGKTGPSSRPADNESSSQRFLKSPAKLAITAYCLAHLFAVYVAATLALCRAPCRDGRRDLPVHALLVGVMLYLLILSAGPEAGSRFRVPIMPFLALYAGWGMARLGGWFRDRYRRGRSISDGAVSRRSL